MNLHAKFQKRRMIREKARKIESIKKTCLVLGTGIVIGAGFGILIAPQSGKETRILIVNNFSKGVRSLKSCCAQDRTETIENQNNLGDQS